MSSSQACSRAFRLCGLGPARLLFVWMIVAGCGCGDNSPGPSTTSAAAQAPRLLLYCGAGIRPAADEIVKAFEQAHGVVVECDYDGSERLLARIKLSGLGDLYMPGDVHYVEKAAEEGLVAEYENACYFIPVILVQKGNPKNIRSLADLTRHGVEVGLGNPEVCAIGRKSLRILDKNEISMEDMRPNLKFQSLTVNDLGNHIKLGQLDAVIVWDAMAAYFAESGDVVPIPPERNVISTVAVGALTSSEHPDLARKFLGFVASDQGTEIFQRHNYTTKLSSDEPTRAN